MYPQMAPEPTIMPAQTFYTSSDQQRQQHQHANNVPPITKVTDQISFEAINELMQAASHNQVKLVNDIIKSGYVSVDAEDVRKSTALLYASINGHINVVRKLIELGANVNYAQPYTMNTALHLAAQCGHTRTVEVLLKSGRTNVRLQNREGKTAFQLAKDFGHGNNKVMKRLFAEHRQQNGGNGHNHQHHYQSFSINNSNHGNHQTRNVIYSNSSLGITGSALNNENISPSLDLNNNSIVDDLINDGGSQLSIHTLSSINMNGNDSYGVSIRARDRTTAEVDGLYRSNHRSNSTNLQQNSTIETKYHKNSILSLLSKDNSMLPSRELLTLFSHTGIYFPMSSGKGFEFLAAYGEPQEMLSQARVQLEMCDASPNELSDKLKRIVEDFQNDVLFHKELEHRKMLYYQAKAEINKQPNGGIARNDDEDNSHDHDPNEINNTALVYDRTCLNEVDIINKDDNKNVYNQSTTMDQFECGVDSLSTEWAAEMDFYNKWKCTQITKVNEMIQTLNCMS